jgi:hypothetical protein
VKRLYAESGRSLGALVFGIRRKRGTRNSDTSVSVEEHPAIWLCVSCAILARVACGSIPRGSDRRSGNALRPGNECSSNGHQCGSMPEIGMPSSVHPASPMWHAASQTRLPLLADQARLGLFSVGDIALLLGGILIVAICLRRVRVGLLRPVL